jgi:outer membrane lipoprotein-sorting protein
MLHHSSLRHTFRSIPIPAILLFFVLSRASAEDPASHVIQMIDAAVQAREEAVLAYTVTEHYALFRNHDEQNPAADMTVKTSYTKDAGKSYAILSENGSALFRKVLETVLDNEKRLNQPANRVTALIDSANYNMTVKGTQTINGHDCIALDIKPRHSSPYLLRGTVWVDKNQGSIVQLEGTPVKSPSIFAGPSQLSRQYAMIDGVAMATYARAVSNSWMVGQTIITISYKDYQIQLRPHR